MKLTKQKLKEIIKEELLKEYRDISDPIKEIRELLKKFDGDLDYYAGGSTDSDSVEYEGPGGGHKYDTIYKEMVKFRKNFDKMLKKALNDYKKAWK
jgi:hypothetical protein